MDKQNISRYLKVLQEGTTTEKLKAIKEIENDRDFSQGIVILIQAFADECWIVRKSAHEALVGRGDEVVNKLEANFPFENPDIAYWTVKTYEKLGGSNYRQIIKMLDSHDSLTISACLRALGNFSNDEVVSLLIHCLKDTDWYIRKEAARSLEKIGDYALAPLKQAFVDNMNRSESEDVSYWTIRLLARIIGVKAIPSFMNLFKSEKQNIRYYAVTALGEIDDEEATKYLINALEDKSWIIRERSAELLKARGESVISTLKAAFYSKGSDTKFWTIKILSSIMGSGGIEFLAKVAKSEEEEIKYFVINALGENQDEQSIRLLISFFQEKSWILRKRASEILQKIGNRSIDYLIENTKSDNKDERYFSLNTLAYIGGRAHDYLAGLLESGDYKVKQDIVNSFEDIPNDIAVNKNLRFAFYNCLSDSEWKIRYSAAKLLDQISDKIFSELLELFARKSSDINYWISQIVVKNIDDLYQKLEVLLNSKDSELIALAYNIVLWTLKDCAPEIQIKFLKLTRLYYQNKHFPAFFTFIKQLPARYLMFLLDFMTTVIPRTNLNTLIKEHLTDDDYFIRSLFIEIAFIIDDSEVIENIKKTLADPKSPTYEK
ncbi:HEAT repeat domain-containing protein, partial [bacterium]|nr:HEAT repeat domain-containing protein [bacterium]